MPSAVPFAIRSRTRVAIATNMREPDDVTRSLIFVEDKSAAISSAIHISEFHGLDLFLSALVAEQLSTLGWRSNVHYLDRSVC